MHAVPDLASFRVAGWTDGVGIVMCDTVDNSTHEPVAMDARNMLKRQIARAKGIPCLARGSLTGYRRRKMSDVPQKLPPKKEVA